MIQFQGKLPSKSSDNNILKWIALFSLCMNSITSVFLFNAFSPIWSNVALYYQTTDYNLNWFCNCYFLGPIFLTPLLNPFILKYFSVSQIISNLTTMGGLWLLYFAKRNYQQGLFAFVLIGFGQSLYFHVPLHLSKVWFASNYRIMSTFIGQYSSNIGLLLGYLVSSIAFYEIVDENEFNKKFEYIIFLNAICASLIFPFSLFLLKNSSKKSERQLEIRDSMWKSMRKICFSLESLFDFLSVSSFIGYSWCYPTLFSVQQLLAGQTSQEIIINSINFQIGQIFAAAYCTYKLQKQANEGMQLNYDKFIKKTLGIGFSFLSIELLIFENLPFTMVTIANFVIGAGLGGLYSVLLESLMEKHYPAQELAVASLLELSACAFSLIITMILVIPEFLQYGFQIYTFLMIPPFCYIYVFYKTNYKRFEYEG